MSVDPASEAQQPPTEHDSDEVLGRRIAAGLIDVGLMFVLFLILGVTIGDTESRDGTKSVYLSGGPFLVYLGLVLLYYFLFEATSGRTVGKLALGLRVISHDGGRPSIGAIVLRTVLRIVDWLPLLYLVGFIALLATGTRRQRLGDLAAKTRVVRATVEA